MTTTSAAPKRRTPIIAVLAVLSLALLLAVRLTSEGAGPDPAPPSTGAAPVEEPIRPKERVSTDGAGVDLRGLEFEDVTDEAGLGYDPADYLPESAMATMTSGLARGTIDGEEVVLVTSPGGPIRVYAVLGGRFVDRTNELGLRRAGRATAAGFADLDGDGDQDLVLGHQIDSVVSVYTFDGGVFTDTTRASGVRHLSTSTKGENAKPAIRGIAFADVDRDGRLDFLIADWNPSLAWAIDADGDPDPDRNACSAMADLRQHPSFETGQSRLYLGGPEGRFTEASLKWGLDLDHVFAFTPQFTDLDQDGWPDLVITGDVCSSRVYRNDGGKRFVEVTDQTEDDMTPFGMGSVLRDLDGDERPDWLVTGISYPTEDGRCPSLNVISGCSGNRVFLGGEKPFSFTDATDRWGLRDAGWAWGVAVEDFANTGDLEVAITNGFRGGDADEVSQWGIYDGYFHADPLSFFVRDPSGTYVDAAAGVGLDDTGVGLGMMAWDYDRDGRLDLLVNNSDTGLRLFRNLTPVEGRHWVRVQLPESGWGARVRVSTASGKVTNGWLTSTTSYMTTVEPSLHVGLGSEAEPVTVEVWWPGTKRPQILRNQPIDTVLELQR